MFPFNKFMDFKQLFCKILWGIPFYSENRTATTTKSTHTNFRKTTKFVSHFMSTAKHIFCLSWECVCYLQIKVMFFDPRKPFISLFRLLTTLLCVHWIDGGSGRFLTMQVRLMVEPIFMKISPVGSPSRIPNIWVMGSTPCDVVIHRKEE